MYNRVVPRDFFNEAKLLKCLGQFALCVLDNTLPREFNSSKLAIEYDGQPFDIQQNPHDGSIFCANYHVWLDDEPLKLWTPLNSREAWPMLATFRGSEYYLFDDNGKWMPNFGVMK